MRVSVAICSQQDRSIEIAGTQIVHLDPIMSFGLSLKIEHRSSALSAQLAEFFCCYEQKLPAHALSQSLAPLPKAVAARNSASAQPRTKGPRKIVQIGGKRPIAQRAQRLEKLPINWIWTVSYTHLTLPTKRIV